VLGGGMGILVVWAMSYCGFIFHDTKSQKQKQQQRRQQKVLLVANEFIARQLGRKTA